MSLFEWSLVFQTTRIKGIMPKGLEVELELLGVKGMYVAIASIRSLVTS